MKMNKEIFSAKNIAVTSVTVVLFAVSLLIYILKFPGFRKVFIFQSTDSSGLSIERRYLPPLSGDKKIENYVSELLLGPVSEHCMPVFALGPRVLSCFEREGVLYVDLSQDMLVSKGPLSDFKKGISLFEKNIYTNFPSVKKVEVFIEGHKPYEY